jgi:hypothetical protein
MRDQVIVINLALHELPFICRDRVSNKQSCNVLGEPIVYIGRFLKYLFVLFVIFYLYAIIMFISDVLMI